MAHDNSLASLMEDWICTQIRAITIGESAVFETAEVQPWNGTFAPNMAEFAQELFSGARDLLCRVYYQGDRVVELAGGDLQVIPRYHVLVGIANRSPQAARRGDGKAPGTNLMRELLRAALHDKRPLSAPGVLVNDGVTAVDLTFFRGSQVIVNTRTHCVQQTVIEAHEVPKAD